MFEFFGRKKNTKKNTTNASDNHTIRPHQNDLNISGIYIDIEDLEKQMDELMNELMKSQSGQGKPNMFHISIKIDNKGNRIINQKPISSHMTDMPQMQQLKENDVLADICDLGDKIMLVADLRGINKDNIKINVENDAAILIKVNDEQKAFAKRFELPAVVDKDSLKTKFNNGILEITINKKNR